MKVDFGVFIPTRGRVGLNKQVTLKDIMAFTSLDFQQSVYIVCPPDEADAHREYWSKDLVLPCPAEGIGATRQWILENSPFRYVVQCDDDHYFSRREDPDGDEELPLRRIENLELEGAFNELHVWMAEGFVHTSISARQGNNHTNHHCKDVARANNCHGYDRDVLLGEGVGFGRMKLMEDFDVTLQLLELGYPNRVSYKFCWNQKGSGLAGGCSLYRTPELQAEAARELQRLHGPEIVKLVTKQAKSNWDGMAERLDVNIQWRKAFGTRVSERKLKNFVVPEWDTESYAVKDF